jgi:MFS family permease
MNLKDVRLAHDPYGALRYPAFRSLILGNFVITIAQMVQEVAIGYELYRITHDPFSLGMIGLVEAVPFISLTLFGGHIADRYSKRAIIVWSVGGVLLSSLILQIAARQQALLSPSMFLVIIYAALFIIGLCRAFYSPTTTSLRGILVPPPLYENAATWGSSAWQVGAILGPVLSGFLYAWFGFANTIVIATALVLISLVLYSRIGETPMLPVQETEGVLKSIGQGIRFVFKTKIILYSISLDLFSVLFGGVVAILPIYAQDILKVGSQGLGILRAASSAGAIITMMLLTRYSAMNKAWRNLLVAVSGFGVSILTFAVSPWMALSVAMLFFGGAFDSISVIIRATILQTMTPDKMRARVMAVNGIFIASSNELGAFESGLAAKFMGTVPSAIFGGAMTLLIAGWVYMRSGDLMKIKIQKP